MVYQLLRTSIETVIDYCGDLLADEKLEDYLDTDTENLDKDSIENLLDQVSEQMPDEESFRYYSKYCLDADNSVEIKEDLISTNMGDISRKD